MDLATSSQVDYIYKLIDMASMQLEVGDYIRSITDDRVTEVENLTKQEASIVINDLKELVGWA